MARRTLFWFGMFLAVLVLVLGLRQWKAGRPRVHLSPTPTPLPRLFPAHFVEEVNAVEVYRDGRLLAKLEKDPQDHWQVLQGPEPARDPNAVVQALLQTRVSAVLPSDVDEKAVGLAQPRMQIRVISTRGFYNLDLGHETPVGKGVYVRRSPRGEIFAVPAEVMQNVLSLFVSPTTPTNPPTALTPTPGEE